MTIQSYINELESIKIEIKRNNERNKKLRQRQKKLENEITQYLDSKEQKGLKYRDQSYIIENTVSHKRLKKKDKESETKRLLKNFSYF